MEENEINDKVLSASSLLEKLFDNDLLNPIEFNQQVVQLTKQHLGGSVVQTKAGNNLADALISLAKTKAGGKNDLDSN